MIKELVFSDTWNSLAERNLNTTGVEKPTNIWATRRETGRLRPLIYLIGGRGDDVAITQKKKFIIITSMHQVIRVDYAIIAVLVMQDGLVRRRKFLEQLRSCLVLIPHALILIYKHECP
jgi:hypothetical protein